jgi:hypothetical protein
MMALKDPGESMDILFCGDECVAEWAEEKLEGKQITLRWWAADREEPDEAIKRRALEQVMGKVDVEWGARYSEVTGYLWTDEEFKVGGHDMIARLKSDVGKYLLLEAEVSATNSTENKT